MNHTDTDRVTAMVASDKVTAELDGATLKIHLTADLLKLVEEAYEKHNDTRDVVGGLNVNEDWFISRVLFGSGLTFISDCFQKWLKSRLEDVKESDDVKIEAYEEERAKYCDECDELLEDCVCDEDEDEGCPF